VEREAERPAGEAVTIPIIEQGDDHGGSAAETVTAEPVAAVHEPEMASPPLAEPAKMPEPEEMPEPAAEHPMATPANDVVQDPAILPIVIGSAAAPPVEKKRGWWRR
jgi:hypothetical protein